MSMSVEEQGWSDQTDDPRLREFAEAEDRFLSFVSHDIRGSINGVLLMMEVIRRDLSDEERFAETVSDIGSIRQSLLTSIRTMDRLVQAERLRIGRTVGQPREVSLRDLVQVVVRRSPLDLSNLSIDVADVTITADGELLGVALQALLENARKHAPGPVELTLEANGREAQLRLSVRDHGPGLSAERLDRLLAGANGTRYDARTGLNIGLMLAHRAMTAAGGRLTARSVPGEGSEFTLLIPRSVPAGQRSHESPPQADSNRAARTSSGR